MITVSSNPAAIQVSRSFATEFSWNKKSSLHRKSPLGQIPISWFTWVKEPTQISAPVKTP